jgi:uncharacterized FlaG/YvyC family protein
MSNDFMSRRKAQLEKELSETDLSLIKNKPKASNKSNVYSHNASGKNKDPKTQDIVNIIESAKAAGEELQKQKVQREKDLEFSYDDNLNQILPPPQKKDK